MQTNDRLRKSGNHSMLVFWNILSGCYIFCLVRETCFFSSKKEISDGAASYQMSWKEQNASSEKTWVSPAALSGPTLKGWQCCIIVQPKGSSSDSSPSSCETASTEGPRAQFSVGANLCTPGPSVYSTTRAVPIPYMHPHIRPSCHCQETLRVPKVCSLRNSLWKSALDVKLLCSGKLAGRPSVWRVIQPTDGFNPWVDLRRHLHKVFISWSLRTLMMRWQARDYTSKYPIAGIIS